MQKINKKGFTLIELLVVIAIIGLLSTLAVVSLNNARQKSRDARRVSDVKQVQTALELYYNDASGYPPSGSGSGELAGPGNAIEYTPTGGSQVTYMAVFPTAPAPDDCLTSDGNDYVYFSDSSTTYKLSYCLGASVGGVPVDIQTATPSGLYTP